LPSLSPQQGKASTGSVTGLANGLTIVTEDASSTTTIAITYPKAGSANEEIDEQGAAFLNKCMAFRSGSDMSSLFINRVIEDAGGTPFVYGDRSGLSLGFTVLPDMAVDLVGLLSTQCSFEKWDVREAQELAKYEAAQAYKSAQIVLTEALYAAAFGPQSPAGRPYYSPHVSIDAVKAFNARTMGLAGAYLVATGIKDHAAFCTDVSRELESAVVGEKVLPAQMEYLGGESRVSAPASGYAHISMAFSAPQDPTLTGVIKHTFNILGLESGITGFSSAGLVGVYGGSAGGDDVTDAMSKLLTASISPDTVKRAKNLAKAEALFAVDGGSQKLCQYMTESVLSTCKYSGPGDIAKTFDAVTDGQVKEALSAMLKSNVSLAAVGDISHVPYHATVASRFK
jgi:hypothetical protein